MGVEDVVGLNIVTRGDCCAERLKNLEVRAGMTRVPDTQGKRRLTVNTVVATFPGPAKPRQTYKICFDQEVRAKYVTLQILESSSLEINEVSIIQPGGKIS